MQFFVGNKIKFSGKMNKIPNSLLNSPWNPLSDSIQYHYKFDLLEDGYFTLLVTDYKTVWMDRLDSFDIYQQRLLDTSSSTFHSQSPDKLKSRIGRIINSNQGLKITLEQDSTLLSIHGEAIDYVGKDGTIKKYLVPFPFTFVCVYQVVSSEILYHHYILPSQHLISFLLESNEELKKMISKRDKSIESLTDKLRDSGVNGKLYNICTYFYNVFYL